MVHVDLFSGIGGFAYAADQVFGDVTHIFCDSEPFAQAVLKKHWPESEIYEDVRKFRPRVGRVDLLTGGFPCQPFSAAGVRRGTNDERYLWPAMLEVIHYCQPTWVIAENVGGLLTWEEGLVFEQVCSDLEDLGYEVQPFVIPAAAVGAPHRRDRVWFVANSRCKHGQPWSSKVNREEQTIGSSQTSKAERHQPVNTHAKRHDTNPNSERLERECRCKQEYSECTRHCAGADWSENWTEVATRLCSVDDGLPGRMGDTTISKPRHRKEQLKAYGNAIVPQVAMEIMRGMRDVQTTKETNRP